MCVCVGGGGGGGDLMILEKHSHFSCNGGKEHYSFECHLQAGKEGTYN